VTPRGTARATPGAGSSPAADAGWGGRYAAIPPNGAVNVSAEENMALVRRFLDEVYNKGN
jgi:hypothetical protein